MQRPLYIVGQAEPIGFEEVPDFQPPLNGAIIDADAIAVTRKQFFDAYLRAGFSGDQALELCKLARL